MSRRIHKHNCVVSLSEVWAGHSQNPFSRSHLCPTVPISANGMRASTCHRKTVRMWCNELAIFLRFGRHTALLSLE